jgi:hypothetical protein
LGFGLWALGKTAARLTRMFEMMYIISLSTLGRAIGWRQLDEGGLCALHEGGR